MASYEHKRRETVGPANSLEERDCRILTNSCDGSILRDPTKESKVKSVRGR
jgi:hypothetical protein